MRLIKVCLLVLLAFSSGAAAAGPWVEVGNSSLRSDIQILADAGIIKAAVTTWPLAWEDIAADISKDREPDATDLKPYQAAALRRVQQAEQKQNARGRVQAYGRVALAKRPIEIRNFEDTPREDKELELGGEWANNWLAVNGQVTWVDDPSDGDEWRADGSYVALMLGNWSLAASVQDRWWGPGWQSSMILSNNARPIPAITFDRTSTRPFKTKWLSWLGSWDLSIMSGFLEEEREVPNALFFGMRLNVRPLDGLEIGLSRTAQWCGDGRPCGLDTFTDLFLGNDNRGDNVSPEDEPGNQLGGFDIRWSDEAWGQPFALYTQWIGEDEAGDMPSKYSVQIGSEIWGNWNALGTYRMFLEWADTMCNAAIYKGSDGTVPDCTYNHNIYETGYRYKGRSIAHTFDNDASIFTLGTLLTDNSNNSWFFKLGYGNLNRKADPDSRNTVAKVKTEYREVFVSHRRNIVFGEINVGAGYDYRKNTVTGAVYDDERLFIEWIGKWDIGGDGQ